MKPLIGVVVDCRSKGLEVAPRPTSVAAMGDVLATRARADVCQDLAAPKVVEPTDPTIQVIELVPRFAGIGQVNRQHVGTVDLLDVAPTPVQVGILRQCNLLRACSASFGGFVSVGLARHPVAICRPPSLMIQTAWAMGLPRLNRARRLYSRAPLPGRGIIPSFDLCWPAW